MAITFTKQDNGYVKIRFTSNSIVYLRPDCDLLLHYSFEDVIIISTKTEGNYSVNWHDVKQPLSGLTFSSRQELQKILAENFFIDKSAGTDIKISATGTSASANVVATAQIRGWVE